MHEDNLLIIFIKRITAVEYKWEEYVWEVYLFFIRIKPFYSLTSAIYFYAKIISVSMNFRIYFVLTIIIGLLEFIFERKTSN